MKDIDRNDVVVVYLAMDWPSLVWHAFCFRLGNSKPTWSFAIDFRKMHKEKTGDTDGSINPPMQSPLLRKVVARREGHHCQTHDGT